MTKIDKILLGIFLVLWFLIGELMYGHVVEGHACLVVRGLICGVFGLYFACRCIRTYVKKKKFLPRHFAIALICAAGIVLSLCDPMPYH